MPVKKEKKKISRGDLYKKNKDIIVPKQDIKVELGQPTFIKTLTKIVKKNK